ncbi:hypothetical protein [Streptococcus moroccensis]|uniref:Uncharacterized protein n=1 Tax=Streptococcus moroccensis TaxID=1451356 RepID=A0ABT9YRP3_9STRE|nr:hypothetical protein [Streptococcus moroccensis]MDQ0222276.1 hypothetical protein [Streptococcus moroccensis]
MKDKNTAIGCFFVIGVILLFVNPLIGGVIIAISFIIAMLSNKDQNISSTGDSLDQLDVEVSTEIKSSGGLVWDDYPDVSKYRVNPSGLRYDDTYFTGTGYKLRELLLLIWWGRTKKPRQPSSQPPRYFYYDYHLNTEETTGRFIREGYLTRDDKNRVVLTEQGKELYSEFEILWELHSYKGFLGELPNLDQSFEDWDYKTYKANNNLLEIRHLQEIIKFNTNMQKQYPRGSNEYNAFQQDIERDKRQIEFLLSEHEQLIDN